MIRPLAVASVGAASLLALAGTPALASAAPAATSAPTAVGSHHLVPGPHGLHPSAARGRAATETSENWSGYIASGSSGAYSSTSASWTVPTVSTQYNGYSSTWVGIDGASSSDTYLIQTGTEADMQNGQATYDAWWEVITPSDEAPETLYSNLPISPGDSISASVTNDGNGQWTMSLTDNTTGQTGTETTAYAGPGESAEWIQEDTDVNNEISSAPDWGQVTFSGITENGSAADLSSASSVNIVDSQGTQEDTTSAPNGNSFNVTWDAPGTPTPA